MNWYEESLKEGFSPKPGELVLVSNELPNYFVQRFVIFHNGLYFCERDDGVTDKLAGWKYCVKNRGFAYHNNPLNFVFYEPEFS